MKIPPIEVIASWPKPNYINPESRAPAGKIIGSILLSLVTVILVIRLYSRKRLTNGFGSDDMFICLAYLPATAFTILGISTQYAFQWGRHLWDVEPKIINLFLFDLATSLTKLSMLAMVRRLTIASSNKIEGVAVLLLAALITTNCFIFIIVEIFQCWYVKLFATTNLDKKFNHTTARPISSAWTVSGNPTHCINEEVHLMAANIINTVTDFVVVLLPIRTTMSLDIPPRHRVVVISLFGIGLVASSVGIARTYFTWLLFTATDYDTTWRAWYLWLSSLVELHLGIICASVPATRPFFTSHLASMLGFTKTRQKPLVLSSMRSNRGDEHKSRATNTSVSFALHTPLTKEN
ncbi:hypothetical protein F4859DRAFT_521526 [Xylaria cf. heliscus]|nr:hypothetical protein F4859DRAFT_521526 [Xylaria cf. heliscus]